MKLLKRYFLFVSRAPFMCAWFEASVPLAVGLMYLIFFCENTGKNTEYFTENFYLGLLIAGGVFTVLGLINYSVVRLKITTLSLKENELALIHYPAPGNEVKISRKSIWGKYFKTIIRFPFDWNIEVKKGDENKFHTGITIIVNSDVRLFISVTFNFIFSGPFIVDDLRSRFMDGDILDEVDVNNFMLETFNDLNLSGEVYYKLTQDAKSYYNKSMSKREFIDCVQHTIQFPKLFSNVAATSVIINNSKFNYSTILNAETEI